MEYRILGPLEVLRDGNSVVAGGPRQQIILSMLLLEPDHVISIERLITAVWDEELPATAREQVQICISALRSGVVPNNGQRQIVRRRPGYLITLGDDVLDRTVFDARVAAARALMRNQELFKARDEFRGALELWRGRALDGIPSRLVQQSVTQLNELRLTIIEECIDCELQLGMHQQVVGELVGLVEEYPLCERLRAQLMLALCGAGPAEALNAYRYARKTLIEELGIEPSKELQDLHQEILDGRVPLRGASAPRIQVSAPLTLQGETVLIPRLLRAAISDFTGYGEIVDRLVTKVTEGENSEEGQQAVPISMIVGPGGVGKTTLAVHLAHKLAQHFPDGQLFARLRDGERPVDPNEILGRFLRAFGFAGPALPDGIEERAEIYRNVLGNRSALIILDDAMFEQQIAALLPGNARCSVIVTSRKRLTGIAADRVELLRLQPRERGGTAGQGRRPGPDQCRAGGCRGAWQAVRVLAHDAAHCRGQARGPPALERVRSGRATAG